MIIYVRIKYTISGYLIDSNTVDKAKLKAGSHDDKQIEITFYSNDDDSRDIELEYPIGISDDFYNYLQDGSYKGEVINENVSRKNPQNKNLRVFLRNMITLFCQLKK